MWTMLVTSQLLLRPITTEAIEIFLPISRLIAWQVRLPVLLSREEGKSRKTSRYNLQNIHKWALQITPENGDPLGMINTSV